MFKHLLLATSIFLSSFAHAVVEWEGKPDALQVSGFVYATEFSDSDWYNGRNIAAVNIDYDTNLLAFRTQLQSYDNQHIRRLVAEYSMSPFSNVEFIGQVGRFSRVDALFNGVTDNPASYQMAMMPNAGYSYRMFNGAFVIMDGVTLQTSWRNQDMLIKVRYSEGKSAIPSQSDIIEEAFKRTDLASGNNRVELTAKNSTDIGFTLDTEKWHL